MFEIGEKIICVDSGNVSNLKIWNIKNGNIYTVKLCFHNSKKYFVRIDGEITEEDFFTWRFISVKKQRKLKIEKINENRR